MQRVSYLDKNNFKYLTKEKEYGIKSVENSRIRTRESN